MLRELQEDGENGKKIMCESNGNISKETENLKRNRNKIREPKSPITKVKNSLAGVKGRFEQAERRAGGLNVGRWKLLNLRNRKEKVDVDRAGGTSSS